MRSAQAPADVTVGRVLPRFVLPADVRALKERLVPFVYALDQTASSCEGLKEETRSAWRSFSASFRAFYAAEESFWSAGAEMDQAESYERDLARWQEHFAGLRCRRSVPQVVPSTDRDRDGERGWQRTVQTVAIAGAVVAAVWGLRTVLK